MKKLTPLCTLTLLATAMAFAQSEQECMLTGRVPTELGGNECALEDLARHVGRFAENAYNGENKLAVFTGPEGSGYYPILIALEPTGEAFEHIIEVSERIATAFERIADVMAVERRVKS
jgi:hypothetical protein